MNATWNPNAHRGTQSERKARYMTRELQRQLGSAYSWDQELYYIGNPLVFGATDHENAIVAKIERNWNEAIRTYAL